MNISSTSINDVKIITPKKFADSRGMFSETYNLKRFSENGIELNFVQDNHVSTQRPGTIRGLHFQTDPAAQGKLVRVTRGEILDVAVDLRRSSKTFGRWVSEILSAENGKQILVPVGFAHGYCTLVADSEVVYKVTDYWSPDHERGVIWSDPDLAIDWRVAHDQVMVADKDAQLPSWKALTDFFD